MKAVDKAAMKENCHRPRARLRHLCNPLRLSGRLVSRRFHLLWSRTMEFFNFLMFDASGAGRAGWPSSPSSA